METRTRALQALLDAIVVLPSVDPSRHAVHDCITMGNRFVRVDALVDDVVNGIILFFVESRHAESVGGVLQCFDVLDDYVANTIFDGMPADQASADVIARVLSREVRPSMDAAARCEAAHDAFAAAVKARFQDRCLDALLATEREPGVRALPRVTIDDVAYFVDERLGELRRCDNPHERLPL